MIQPHPLDDPHTASDEQAIVAAWRLERLLQLGVPYDTAIHLDIDHHQLETLTRRGCSLDTAIRILS